ncbi:protein outspread isoform X1, partial [Huso huso]
SVTAAEEATRMEVDGPQSPTGRVPPHVENHARMEVDREETKQIPITMRCIPIHCPLCRREPLPPQELAALLDKELGQTQRELSRLKQENHLLQEQLEGARGREHSAREGYVLQVTPEHSARENYILQVTPEHSAREGYVLQVTPEHSAREGYILQVTPEHSARENYILQVTPEHSAREGYVLQTDTAASPMGSWQRLHKLNQDLQTEIESQRQRQDLTNQQVQALKRNYGEAKDVIRNHEVEIQNLQTKLNNTMAGIQISEQAIAKMRSDLKMEQEKFREGLEDWEHNEQTLRSQLRDSEDRLKDVEALLLEKSQALRDLERQQALQRDYQKEVQKLQDRLTEVTSQLVTTEQAQGLKEERVQKDYKMLCESHEKEKESLALSLVEAERKVREFEDRLQEAEQQVDNLQKEKRTTTLESSEVVHHLEEELVIKNVTIQKLTENIRDLEEEKNQLTCRCQELISQITEADNEVAKLQSRLKTEETDYYNLEHSYEKVSEELQKIHKVISEKDEEIKQAKEMYERLMEKKDRDLNEALIKMAALGSSLEETECKLQLKEELISKIGHSGSEAGSAVQKEGLQCKLEAAEVRITELQQLLDDLQLGYSELQLENGKLQEDCDDHENIRKQESSTALDQPQTTNVRPKVRITTDTGAVLSKRQRIRFSSIHCQKCGQDDTEKLWASNISSDTSQDRSLSEESGSSDPPHHYLPSANTDPERFISIIHSLETKLYITEEKLKDVTLKLEEQQSRQLEVMMEHHSKWAKTETELREQLGESVSKVDTLTAQLQLEMDKRRAFAQENICHIRAVRVTCEKALVCLESGREKVQSILTCHDENSTDQQLHTLSEIEVELVNAAIHIGQGRNTLEEQAQKCQEAPKESRENELSDEEKIKLFAKTLAFEALVLNEMANSIQNPNLDLLQSLSEVHKEAEKLKSSDESYVAIAYTDVLTQKLMLESEFWSEVEKLQTQFKETDNSGQESKPGGPGLLEQAGKTVVTNTCIKAELTFAVQNLKEFYEQKIQVVEGDLLKARRDLQQREFTLKEIVKAYKTPELDRVILEVGDEFKKERGRKLADISPPELAPYVEQIEMEEAHNLAVLMVDQHLQYETPPCRLAAVEPSSWGRDKLADELKQQAEVLQRLSQDMESTCHSQTVEIHHRLHKVSHMLPCYMYTNEINTSPSLLMRDALIQAQVAYVACRIKADHEKDLKQCKDAYRNMDTLCQEHAKNVNSIRERYEKALQEELHTFAQAAAILKDENQALKAEAAHHLSELSLQQSRILQMDERFQHEMEELKNKYKLDLHQAQHKLTEAEGALREKTAESQRKLETVVLDIESMEERHEDQVQKLEDRFHGKIQELQRIHEKEMLRLHGHYTQTIKALQLTLDKYKSEHVEASPSESCKHHKEPRPEDSTARTQTQGEKSELDSMTVLRERIQELEAQMNVMRDELEHKHLEGDVSSLKEKYQKDFENFKATCERGFAAMEETHQKVLEDIQRQHQREVGKLREEKDRLLAEETAATIAAIEAMKNAHREELERTQRAQISGMSSDIEELRRQYQEELQSVQRELEVLSEQYSQKCLENAHLAQALEAERQALRQCQRENQDLNAHNQELNNRLAAEITRLWSCHSGDGAGSPPLTQGKDVYELEVLLRVKESEIQYLKQEIHSLKDELQTALRDKKYTTDKYKDLYTELSIVKAKAECDITKLRDQLIAATEALGERSAENSTVSGYDIMKSKSNPDFLKKERSSISRQIRSMRSKSLKEGLSVQERLKLFEARDSKKI